MKIIKILGTGCKSCEKTYELVKKGLSESGTAADVQKVTDLQEIMKYKVMSTPAVVVDEKVVHSGSVPSAEQVRHWC